MGVIATAVEHLLAAGVTGAALVQAIADMEAATSGAPGKVDAAEKRREFDRERKRRKAAEKKALAEAAERNSTGNSTGNVVESAESERNSGGTAEAPSLSLSPNENNSNPHTHTHPDNIPAHEADAGSRDGLGEFEPDPVPTFTPDDLWRMWNRAAQEMGLPKVREMTEARRKRALTMIRKYGREGFVEAISAIERSTFLRGQTEQQFKADLDFLLQQKSFTRLIEGFYDRSSRANSRSRYEPDGAMAYLQRSLGIEGGYEPSGSPGRWDDGQPQGGHLLPDSRG